MNVDTSGTLPYSENHAFRPRRPSNPTFTLPESANAIAVDTGGGNLYAGSHISSRFPGSTTPTATLPGDATALAFDSSGNLYAVIGDGVWEFAPGGTTPIAEFDAGGIGCSRRSRRYETVYLAGRFGVAVFAAGATTPTAFLLGWTRP